MYVYIYIYEAGADTRVASCIRVRTSTAQRGVSAPSFYSKGFLYIVRDFFL